MKAKQVYVVTMDVFNDFDHKQRIRLFGTKEKALAFVKEKYEEDKNSNPNDWEDDYFIKDVDLENGYFTIFADGEALSNSVEVTTELKEIE